MIAASFGAGLLVFVQLSEDWLKINAFPCDSLMVVLHLKYSHHKMCLRTIWRQYSYLYATAWSQLASIGGSSISGWSYRSFCRAVNKDGGAETKDGFQVAVRGTI